MGTIDEDVYEDPEPAWWCEWCEEYHDGECPYAEIGVVNAWPVL